MKAVHDFACGAIVGVANIIPGVSGGTMGVVLGVYQQMLEVMSLKNLRKNIPFLIPFGLGAALGILGFSRAIEYLLANFPMATNFVFLGLIFGSVPMIGSKIQEMKGGKSLGLRSLAAFALMLAFMLWLNSATGGAMLPSSGFRGQSTRFPVTWLVISTSSPPGTMQKFRGPRP